MDKVYIVCYKMANELDDIVVCTNLEAALKLLDKARKSKQILEFNIVDGVSEEVPEFVYYYNEVVLVKHRT